MLVCGFALRLYGIRHGLPFVYHSDEVFHFTSRAVAMFSDGLNPNYFQNPSAFTYLVHLALRFQYGGGWPLGDFGHLVRQLADDPTEVYATARQLATVLSMLGVVAVYVVGRRLWGAMEGLAAAAVLAFAFLPVAYSRLAVTDVGVLLPVALVMLAAVRAHEDGRDRWYLLGGAAAGLAIGFKYTAGLVLAPLLLAAVLRAPRDLGAAIRATAVALAATAVVFVLTTPYFIPDLDEAIAQLRSQSYAADEPKLGQEPVNGHLFYLRSLTWGLGWGAALAAAAGAVLVFRCDRRRLALLALFPILLFAYLGTAERFFGRWLMPVYPVLALLAAVALARAARALSSRPAWRGAALVALLAAVLAQPVAAGLRTGRLLARQDTRTEARNFLLTLPTGTRIVVEPAVPRRWYRGLAPGYGPPPPAKKKIPPPPAAPTRFIDELSPRRLDRYRRDGFCYVVTMSMVRGRAEVAGRRDALAYYRALERQSTVAFRADPYRRGSSPPPFDFDFSTHLYYPRAYDRPGPDVSIHRLDRCRPQTAPVRR